MPGGGGSSAKPGVRVHDDLPTAGCGTRGARGSELLQGSMANAAADAQPSAAVAAAVETVWQYHHLHHDVPAAADGVLCLCSSDIGVAHHAADLFLKGRYRWLLFSGGMGTGMHSATNVLGWDRPEAAVFREAAVARGVPREVTFTEEASTNSGANVRLSREVLERHKLPHGSIVVVQKPFMERRAYATFKKVWAEPSIAVSSANASWDEYATGCELDRDVIINIMVGDLQRIKHYAAPPTDFQIPQEIPAEVWKAFELLVRAGYTDNLLKS